MRSSDLGHRVVPVDGEVVFLVGPSEVWVETNHSKPVTYSPRTLPEIPPDIQPLRAARAAHHSLVVATAPFVRRPPRFRRRTGVRRGAIGRVRAGRSHGAAQTLPDQTTLTKMM